MEQFNEHLTDLKNRTAYDYLNSMSFDEENIIKDLIFDLIIVKYGGEAFVNSSLTNEQSQYLDQIEPVLGLFVSSVKDQYVDNLTNGLSNNTNE